MMTYRMMENLLNMKKGNYIRNKILEMNGTIVHSAMRGEKGVRFDVVVLKVTCDELNMIIGFYEDIFNTVRYNQKSKELTIEW